MATYAKIENGYVVEIVKVDNSCGEPENAGVAFLTELKGGEWVQTWYASVDPAKHPRGKYAGLGDIWDGVEFKSPVVPDPVPTSSPVLVSK